MTHAMKIACVLALALGGALSPDSASARPIYGQLPPRPPTLAQVWYCHYVNTVTQYAHILEMGSGQSCHSNDPDDVLDSSWLAAPGGVLVP
ncbi:MAG: hypothetical protein WAZ48_05245 [Lysobacteraceae bacterium]